MKKVSVLFILIALLLNTCATGLLGVPDYFKGFYQTKIAHEKKRRAISPL